MLLQFTVENFQCIKNRATLDMLSVKGKGITEHAGTLIDGRVLPVAVVYGPNGGGKSTLLRAFGTMRNIVCKHITPLNQQPFLPTATVPFAFDEESKNSPTLLEAVIQFDKKQYRYGFLIYQGTIKREYLYEIVGKKENIVFDRNGQAIEIKCKEVSNIFNKDMIAKVSSNIPFLSFVKQFYDVSPLSEVMNWFSRTLVVDYNSLETENMFDTLSCSSKMVEWLYGKSVKPYFLDFLAGFGIKISNYEIERKQSAGTENRTDAEELEYNVKTYHDVKGKTYSLGLNFESNGTRKLFGLLPLIMVALKEGLTIIVDEMDAKLHPKLLEGIITLFTTEGINPNGAQLIFTSHDMTTMSADIFRRDEIYFMALSEAQDAELFSLVEIRGTDGRVVRRDGSFAKQYLAGKYGADPYFAKMTEWK